MHIHLMQQNYLFCCRTYYFLAQNNRKSGLSVGILQQCSRALMQTGNVIKLVQVSGCPDTFSVIEAMMPTSKRAI